ncbi:phage tail protein [Methylovulum psychrotolerans]|uniref:phage tail protein n=1 Tax=Methylovulum psychrotolerans TaxID=1704499 RepID=UPI001BFF7705|nr:phage tail protein [Methylovulum psychrotolerans]MBT9098390.1 phage tail protein [Methylovulum psychrotolerans]
MGIFGGGSSASTVSKFSSLNVQTAGYGVAIQVCYGRNRVYPTLGYYTDFAAHPQSQGGGKGGGGGSSSYTYSATVIYLLCEGAIRNMGKLWKDKQGFATLASGGFTFGKTGTYPQDAWGYLVTAHPGDALGYSGTALVAASNYDLGNTNSLGNHSVEIFGRCLSGSSGDQNYSDCHIKDIIPDFLENEHYGAIDPQIITIPLRLSAMHDYCAARGILISPLLSAQKPANEYLTEWAMVANAEIVYSEGHLSFLPYSDQSFSNDFATYTPDTEIRAHFDDDNTQSPIKPTRKKAADCYNSVLVEYLNAGNSYNKSTVEYEDQASVDFDGLREMSTLVLDCIKTGLVALRVARCEVSKSLYIRNEYEIIAPLDYDFLQPMDFITASDSVLGLNFTRLRIKAVEDDGSILTITAAIAPIGVYSG